MNRKLIVFSAVGVVLLIFTFIIIVNTVNENPAATAYAEYGNYAAEQNDDATLQYSEKFQPAEYTQEQYVTDNEKALQREVDFNEAHDSLYARGYTVIATIDFKGSDLPLRFNIADGVSLDIAEASLLHMSSVFTLLNEVFPTHIITTFFIEDCINNTNVRWRYIYNDLSQERFRGLSVYLYFKQANRYTLPVWLASGIEDYLMEADGVSFMPKGELALWLCSNKIDALPLFGDAFFVRSFEFYDNFETLRSIAYTTVRMLSDDGVLWDWVRLARENREAFSEIANDFFNLLIEEHEREVNKDFFYHFGSIEVWTQHGMYNYIEHGFTWTWELVSVYNLYMDTSISFVKDWLQFEGTDRINVELNPFSSQNTNHRNVFRGRDERLGLEGMSAYGNFGGIGYAFLTNVAVMGLPVFTHEAVHAVHLQMNPAAPTWVTEGVAMAGESLFREHYYDFITNLQVYNFADFTDFFDLTFLINFNHIHSLFAEGRDLFQLMGTEPTFGRPFWTYEDAGSFTTFLYQNYSKEQFVAFVTSAMIRTQETVAYEIFGKTLDRLMTEWREFLWPCGEPNDWWTDRKIDINSLDLDDICSCWAIVPEWLFQALR